MRKPLLVLAASAVTFAVATPAWAHVTVSAPGATRGGSDVAITFRVPVEEKVPTVAVTIALPTNTPIASVDVAPLAGWTHTEKTVTLAKPITTDDGDITQAVSQISWTARPGQGIQPGEYGSFTILAGSLPDVPTLTFRVLQRYSDGTVVRWIETAAPGSSSEPEDPAPVLTLAPASSAAPSASAATRASSSSSSSTGATVLAVIALVVAAAALGLAVVTRARARTPTQGTRA